MAVQAPDKVTSALQPMLPEPDAATKLEQVVIEGNLAALSPIQRVSYYRAVCESVGLNPLTKPFEYITLNGKLTLYARREATDQLRAIRGIQVSKLERERADDLAIVVAYGVDRTGRQDSALGAVAIKGLQGEALANALMKAETKAKRRLTLSLSGLGMLDEIEVESVPGGWRADVDVATGELASGTKDRLTLEERLAAEAEALEPAGAQSGRPVEPSPGGAVDESEAAVRVGPAADASVEPEAATPPASGSADATPAVSGEVITTPAPNANATCGVVPPNDGLGLTVACTRAPGHKPPHVTDEGSWYDPKPGK